MTIDEKIVEERETQGRRWGISQHPTAWLTILMEEVGEVAKEICDAHFREEALGDNYEKELIQVAAVAVAALENFEKSKKRRKRR